MNPSYRYDLIDLWSQDAWRGREADMQPLVELLAKRLFDARGAGRVSPYAGRADGVWDAKTNARLLPAFMEKQKRRGLTCTVKNIGFVSWIVAAPEGYAPDARVLLTFHSADTKDPFWAMDTLDAYENINEAAAKNGFVAVYFVLSAPFCGGIFGDILLELSSLWRLNLTKLYLNAAALSREDIGVSSFVASDCFGIPVLDVTDRWQARVGHQFIVGNLNKNNPAFDLEKLIHSELGKQMAEGMYLEHTYRGWDDPALLQRFTKSGLLLEENRTAGENWLIARPAAQDRPLPLLICMKEVRAVSRFQSLTALQFYYRHLELAANGQCLLLFFALESPEDNELLCKILAAAEKQYLLDPTRFYITGQSHNGHLALEFARRHPERIAAVATLNDRHGIGSPNYSVDSVPVTDEMIEDFRKHDLPLINICGEIENVFPHTAPGTPAYDQAIDAFRRRLRAFRCPDKSAAEIAASRVSPNISIRENGVPADRTEILYSMGFHAYIADIQNGDGRWHLRFVTLENLPHMISPQMAELSWSFLSRFSRDKKTGAILEEE